MELEELYPAFTARNVAVVAVSTDGVADALNMAVLSGASYPVLADPDAAVSRAYEVFNLLGDGVAAPATFIIGQGRVMLRQYIAADISDRPSGAETYAQLDTIEQLHRDGGA